MSTASSRKELTPGLPATLLTSFGPPLINMAIFSLIYPFVRPPPSSSANAKFLIQALQSRPPSSSSLLPSTPSPGASAPTTPTREHAQLANPVMGQPAYAHIPLQVPIFFFARHARAALGWLADAVARERGGGRRERAMGKRAF